MADGLENGRELGVGLRFQGIETPGELLVRGEDEPQAHEGAHDLDIDGDGAGAIEHRRQHRHSLLAEGIGRGSASAPT